MLQKLESNILHETFIYLLSKPVLALRTVVDKIESRVILGTITTVRSLKVMNYFSECRGVSVSCE